MQDLHKNLIIIESLSSFSINGLFDDAIVEGRIIEKEYKYVFELIFSNDGSKLIAFKRISLIGTNPRRQRIFAASNGRISEQIDYFEEFKSLIGELEGDTFDIVIGGNESNLNKVLSIVKSSSIVDPNLLIDREYFYH